MLSLVCDAIGTPAATARPPAPSTWVAPDLGRAFSAACHAGTRTNHDDLRAATTVLVARLKSAGLPPERVAVAIKAAIMKYGERPSPPSWFSDGRAEADTRRSAVYRRVFSWFLDAYYAVD